MSQVESKFIKWFAGIAAALVIASIMGLVGFYTSATAKGASDDIKFHYIQKDINDIKFDLREINRKIENQNK